MVPGPQQTARAAPLRACPICGGRTCDLLRRQRFVLPEGHPLADGYDVVCCRRCGLVYADTTVSQADYDRFYREHSKYEDRQTSTGGGGAPWDLERLRATAACLADFSSDRQSRILDIGCANGGLLGQLAAMGFTNLMGFDPSPACVAHTQAIAGVQAAVGSLAHVPAGCGEFDLVILSHVLEHVQDLAGAAAAVARLVAPQGAVYLEVPDATRYADAVPAPFQDFNTEHINHFSPAALANLMRRVGMAPVRAGTKTLLAPPPHPYPACWAFYRRSADVPAAPTPDPHLRERIADYIAISARKMKELDEALRAALPREGPVIVWGVGQLAMKLLVETVLGSAAIAAFVDGNPIHQGGVLRGVKIVAPQDIAGLPYPIVIATTLHEAEIAATIRETLGLANPIIRLTPAPAA